MSKKFLGKIEKPSVKEYKTSSKRKVYLIPLLLPGYEHKELLREYQNKLKKYWKQVESQLDDLQRKMGKIGKVYYEMVDRDGEEGAKIIQQMDEVSWKIVKELIEKGASLKGIEDFVLVQEHLDLVRCLSLNLKSPRVGALLSNFFSQNLKERDEYISKKIDEDLKQDEIAVLFIRENNFLKFPPDVEVFRIFPPALDELHHCLERMQDV